MTLEPIQYLLGAGSGSLVGFTLGIVGGIAGAALSHRLSAYKGALNTIFALLIFMVAAYMLWQSVVAILG